MILAGHEDLINLWFSIGWCLVDLFMYKTIYTKQSLLHSFRLCSICMCYTETIYNLPCLLVFTHVCVNFSGVVSCNYPNEDTCNQDSCFIKRFKMSFFFLSFFLLCCVRLELDSWIFWLHLLLEISHVDEVLLTEIWVLHSARSTQFN